MKYWDFEVETSKNTILSNTICILALWPLRTWTLRDRIYTLWRLLKRLFRFWNLTTFVTISFVIRSHASYWNKPVLLDRSDRHFYRQIVNIVTVDVTAHCLLARIVFLDTVDSEQARQVVPVLFHSYVCQVPRTSNYKVPSEQMCIF
jgi:hypothetical protein